MAGWPSIERADDLWLAQALRSGDKAAEVRFYDLYAVRLFDYCHVLLPDERAAALTVVDTLVLMRERIGDLGDPQAFRGRLYSMAREECLRERPALPAERHPADATGAEVDEATRLLVHNALLVLTGRQREALDLSQRHGLTPEELAEVLEITPQDASILVAQARHDLDDAFAAVVVAATGREDCPSIGALAGPPGQRLDAETCGLLTRHITNCPICGTRGDGRAASGRLLHAMPFAAMPGALRDRFLAAAADPEFARRVTARRVPPAEASPPVEESHRSSRLWPVMAAVTVGALAIGGGVLYVLPDSGHENAGNNQSIAAKPDGSSADVPSAAGAGAPRPKDGATSATPSPSDSSKTPTPTPTPHRNRSRSPQGRPGSPSAPTPPSPPAQPASGTLAVSGCTMNGTRHCTVTVVAQGGPVTWSVTGVNGDISASGGGSLSAGQSAGVTVTRDASWCWSGGNGSVSFNTGATAAVSWRC
ncbi:sigma-70 family RNA polymerase sigma factor [Actinomadura sp. DC4]|uniref:RNA polymerase sigma factor n=1 Tax=Actinomadura sp. DC4 TaxID=3055069 RepID=UPI0025B10980|nr:sigma-70 family RNA polymerase sigma factor [Actinomadura sp. DC4]MDN3357378.1 sigma-70 family RNA polymerase sigma factor [Actinomadura sp. DC4]